MDHRQNLEKAFVAVITGSLKAGLGESVVEGFGNKIIGAAVSEATKCAVEGFVGPVLRVLLGLLDETSGQLKQLLSEPLITGVREALRALNVGPIVDPADQTVLFERLHDAEMNLAKALTLLPRKGNIEQLKFLICLLRGLIANRRGAFVVAASELQFCKDIFVPQLAILSAEKAQVDQEQFDRKLMQDALLKCAKHFPVTMRNYTQKPEWKMSLQERIEKARSDAEEKEYTAQRNAESSACLKRILGQNYERLFGPEVLPIRTDLMTNDGDFAKAFARTTQKHAEVGSIVAFLNLACIKSTGNEYPEAVDALLRHASELVDTNAR